MPTLLDATAILAKLRSKLEAAQAREAEIKIESKSVTFDAFVSAGPARKKLDQLNEDRVKAALEIEGLGIAISEAEARVQDAEAEERHADLVAEAKSMQTDLPVFLATAREMAAAAEKWKLGTEVMSALTHSFALRGVPLSQRLVDIQIDRALKTITDPRSVPPTDRHSLSELAEVWAKSVRAVIDSRLGDENVVRIHERETA